MKLVVALAFLASANASSTKIAGYAPGSDVDDHNALDKDAKAMSAAFGTDVQKMTQTNLDNAYALYSGGGNSRAESKFTVPALAEEYKSGYVVKQASTKAEGKTYKTAKKGATLLRVRYTTTCKDGGYLAADKDTSGCFSGTGPLTITKDGAAKTVTPTSQKNAYRTLKGFSGANGKMDKEPYFIQYKAYHNSDQDYGNTFVTAAHAGTGDFVGVDMPGRKEGMMKGAIYLNVFMYTIHEFEDAIDDCQKGCTTCNDDPVHAWDEGVAFYTGSLEGEDGKGKGVMLHALADKRCGNYGTCTPDGGSQVNKDLLELFNSGKDALNAGQCALVVPIKNAIVQKMSIPLVQGTLRYSYKMNQATTAGATDKNLAEGYTFAATVLPLVSQCRRTDAKTIADGLSMLKNVASGKMSELEGKYANVKKAFEGNYDCMNITCGDIGALLDSSNNPYSGAEACTFKIGREAAAGGSTEVIIIAVLGAVAAIALGAACYFRGKAQKPAANA
jgi:hypothetical protein